MTNADTPTFPCDSLPGDASEARLLGIYPMRAEGLFMQRVKVPSGRIEPTQLAAVAGASQRFAPEYPLHVTTRQDIEVHGLKAVDIPAVERLLATAGLSGLGACGDTLRNVTNCPGCGCCPGTRDVSALAAAIADAAAGLPWIMRMPRKFKISLSGCENSCARPWINDVGLVATPRGTFSAVVAGSLGARPGTGVPVDREIEAEEVVPFVLAALKLFEAEGDRKNRSRARLRHVRERLGDEEFLKRLNGLFESEVARAERVEVPLEETAGGVCAVAVLHLPLGDISASDAAAVADAAEANGVAVRIGIEHDLRLYGTNALKVARSFEHLSAGARVVSCPGATWCSRGITDSRSVARELSAQGTQTGLLIAVSGCPNNCSHAAVADVGLLGRVRTIDGRKVEGYTLLAGGGKGSNATLAIELSPFVLAESVREAVRYLDGLYGHGRGRPEGSFEEFIHSREKDLKRVFADEFSPPIK